MDENVSVNTELEVADPIESTQEFTDNDVNTDVETSAESETTVNADEGSTEKPVQSAEENSRYAAARRRAEQEFAERQRAEDLEYERRFKDYENPITHQPIRSRKDYFDALDAQERLQMEQNLASGNVDVKTLDDYIQRQVANNPMVQQAQALMEQNKRAQIESNIAEGVKEIQKLNANVKSIDDVIAGEKGTQIIGYVQNGMSLVDAYKLANFDVLMNNNKNASKQAAINNIKGTQHLNTTDGVSSSDNGGVEIPQSELGKWRRAYPDLSLKELRKKYNKVLGS